MKQIDEACWECESSERSAEAVKNNFQTHFYRFLLKNFLIHSFRNKNCFNTKYFMRREVKKNFRFLLFRLSTNKKHIRMSWACFKKITACALHSLFASLTRSRRLTTTNNKLRINFSAVFTRGVIRMTKSFLTLKIFSWSILCSTGKQNLSKSRKFFI